MSFEHLKPLILKILSAPDTDLTSISAKRVRKALAEEQPDLDIKEHKNEIDAIIIAVFHEIAPPEENASSTASPLPVNGSDAHVPPKRKRSESLAIEDEISPSSPAFAIAAPTVKAKVLPKAKTEPTPLTDEEFARQLHEQLNSGGGGRSTRRGTGYGVKQSGSKGKSKRTKSSQFVEDSDEDGEDMDGVTGDTIIAPRKKAKRERDPDKPSNGGFHKTFALSAELAAVVGAEEMSRPQVIKQLWAYIRENELQDPKDKRKIICDDKLRALFGTARTDGFKMNKPLQKHFYEIDG